MKTTWNKEPKKKRKSRTEYAKAKDYAWRKFSILIRTRDCIKTTGDSEMGICYTCHKEFLFKELQAGHGLPGRMMSILFDEELVQAQCGGCNSRTGMPGEFSLHFINDYGLGMWREKVHSKKTGKKYKAYELRAMGEEFEKRTQELLKLLKEGK